MAMSRTRILFVDDEPYILDALRNLFRRARREWEVVCATSGAEALAHLSKQRFDIAVCDMRMPGMDGAELLERIREDHPRVVRIVMSGQADRDAVKRALPGAQQFLSKPCEYEELRRVIERAAGLGHLLADEELRAVVGRLDRLPSSSATFHELSQLAASPEARIDEIARLVARDPAMSAKVLQLVNSAYFGLARPSASIRHAVSYLGLDLLKALVLTASVFTALEDGPLDGFSIDALQRHSLETARFAKRFTAGTEHAESAFTAGLLHDVGKIILALGAPEHASEVLRERHAAPRPWHEVEEERFGVTHAAVGAFLLGAWGLPYEVVEAVAYHHVPAGVEGEGLAELAAVHVAEALLERVGAGGTPEPAIDTAFLARIGYASDLERWRSIAEEELTAVEAG